MRPARVLIVDDSTVIRRLLSDVLAGDASIEVVGTAPNGRIALQKITQFNPDLVTLDIEMPEMDGLATIAEIRKTHPRLPVIMFSTLTQKGATATLSALSLGASDYVTKPANVGNVTAAMAAVREQLIPKIKGLCRLDEATSAHTVVKSTKTLAVHSRSLPSSLRPPEVIAIGVSTGGPNALTEVFRHLPGDLNVPILIVQHMPPVFTKYLAERLSAVSAIPVTEATSGERIAPGRAWLAPGNFHMALTKTAAGATIQLHQGPPENSCRPAVDVLFRSVAEIYGSRALAVVLTGMGYDGLRGCRDIATAGGHTIIQDEATSVVWGMPGAVASAGLADAVLPLSQIAPQLVRLSQPRRGAPLETRIATVHAWALPPHNLTSRRSSTCASSCSNARRSRWKRIRTTWSNRGCCPWPGSRVSRRCASWSPSSAGGRTATCTSKSLRR
jgi:two-component system chemotaxis response regulator CheB